MLTPIVNLLHRARGHRSHNRLGTFSIKPLNTSKVCHMGVSPKCGASCSQTMLRQMESNPEWRAGIERVLQAISDKINLDFNDLMQEEAESNLDWCSGVERVLQGYGKDVDINALLQPRHPFQSTSSSGSGASRQTSDGTREVRSDARIDHGIDDDQMSA
ncbi:hypothetical protein ACP70R_015941 [Stipagrostis hirtigluma subsp. patula]